jgi:chitin synthase
MMYLPGAKAVTDPPNSFIVLLKQRRRWINGSNAAFIYTLKRSGMLRKTNHNLCRKLFYFINMFFLSL